MTVETNNSNATRPSLPTPPLSAEMLSSNAHSKTESGTNDSTLQPAVAAVTRSPVDLEVFSAGSSPSKEAIEDPGDEIMTLPTVVPRSRQKDNTTIITTATSSSSSSNIMSKSPRSSIQSFHEAQGICMQAILAGQEAQAQKLIKLMVSYFQTVKLDTDRLNVATDQISVLQAELVKTSEMMLHLQKKNFDRLVNLQTQMRALLLQTYELHEYPIPRLFIVLPRVGRFRDKLLKPFSHQLRLYFLCECGAHTTQKGSKEMDEVHLANHSGYDIERPTEFFKKYGSYVLAVMRAVRLGVKVASVVIPHLISSNLAQELKEAESGLQSLQHGMEEYTKEKIGKMVDNTIGFLEDLNKSSEDDGIQVTTRTNSANERSVFEDAEAIEGVELKQLENFLSIKDKGRVLGNLYRSVTPEGHVKWVCQGHFRQKYREQVQQAFQKIIDENEGLYDDKQGSVAIGFTTKTQAKAFYDVLVQVHGVHELVLALNWDVTLADMRSLAETVLKSTVVSLCLHGTFFEGPAADYLNRGRRYDPLIQLLSEGRLQVVQFREFDDFFGRVCNLAEITSIPRLRSLYMCSLSDPVHHDLFFSLIKKCSGLKKLKLEIEDDPDNKLVLGCLRSCPSLKELIIERQELTSAHIIRLMDTAVAFKQQDRPTSKGRRFSLTVSLNGINRASITMLEDGRPLVRTTGIDKTYAQDICVAYGWAMDNVDIFPEQRQPDLHHWLRSIADNGGRSSIRNLQFNGSLFDLDNRNLLLRIVDKSPILKRLGLFFSALHDKQQKTLAHWYLINMGERLNALTLWARSGIHDEIAALFQERQLLPRLESLILDCKGHDSVNIGWLIHLVSFSNPPPFKLTRTEDDTARSKIKDSPLRVKPLRRLYIWGLFTPTSQWQSLFQALDFTTLQYLCLTGSLFHLSHWSLLMESLPEDSSSENKTIIALKILEIKSTPVANLIEAFDGTLKNQLSKKAPLAKLILFDKDI